MSEDTIFHALEVLVKDAFGFPVIATKIDFLFHNISCTTGIKRRQSFDYLEQNFCCRKIDKASVKPSVMPNMQLTYHQMVVSLDQ